MNNIPIMAETITSLLAGYAQKSLAQQKKSKNVVVDKKIQELQKNLTLLQMKEQLPFADQVVNFVKKFDTSTTVSPQKLASIGQTPKFQNTVLSTEPLTFSDRITQQEGLLGKGKELFGLLKGASSKYTSSLLDESRTKQAWVKTQFLKKLDRGMTVMDVRDASYGELKKKSPKLIAQLEERYEKKKVSDAAIDLVAGRIQSALSREAWVRARLYELTGTNPPPEFDKGKYLNDVPYSALREQFPDQITALEKDYSTKTFVTKDQALAQMRLQELAVSAQLSYEKYQNMTSTEKAVNKVFDFLAPEGTGGRVVRQTGLGVAEGLTGQSFDTSELGFDDPDNIIEKFARNAGHLGGFFFGVGTVSTVFKTEQLAQMVTTLSRAKNAKLVTALAKGGIDFALLGQVHGAIADESVIERVKRIPADVVAGSFFSGMGATIGKLPRFLQAPAEAVAWGGISKAMGASNEDALIQGVLMGGLRAFGISPSRKYEEAYMRASEKFLGVKRTDAPEKIIEAFKSKITQQKDDLVAYQKAEAAYVNLLHPEAFGKMADAFGVYQTMVKEKRLIGYKGMGEGRPGIEKAAPLPKTIVDEAKNLSKGDKVSITDAEGTVHEGGFLRLDNARWGKGSELEPTVVIETKEGTLALPTREIKGYSFPVPTVSKELQPLYEEAKKYKSAEEFVQAAKNKGIRMSFETAKSFQKEYKVDLGDPKLRDQRITEAATDIWNQANQKLPDTTFKTDRNVGIGGEQNLTPEELVRRGQDVKVPRGNLPVGEGEVKVSRLEARVQKVLDQTSPEMIEKLGLPTFKQMNKKENIQKATTFVKKEPEKALQVLSGEIEPPKGVLRNSVYVAMQNYTKGNVELARRLASLESTRLGQELSILTEIDPDSPVAQMREIITVREKRAERARKGRSAQTLMNELKEDMKHKIEKTRPRKYSWDAFLKEIQC